MKKLTRTSTNRERKQEADGAFGIDLGDRFSHFVQLSSSGERTNEGRLPTTKASFERHFGTMPASLIAIETGTHSPWVSRLLRAYGHRVVVANARKLRLIYENQRKNDRVDAEYLARLVRLDPQLLNPIEHRDETAQKIVSMLRARDLLVRTRASLITLVRTMQKTTGQRIAMCSAETFVKRARAALANEVREALEPILISIDHLTQQIRGYDTVIERKANDPELQVHRMTQIRGVGNLTAVAFAATIGRHDRFTKSRTVAAWLGLTPGQRASGRSDPQQRITKAGDAYLRRLLVSCAQYILGPFGGDCDLRRFGIAIASRGGKNAKKRAVVAVARKLAVLMHRLWCTGAVYEPLRNVNTATAA